MEPYSLPASPHYETVRFGGATIISGSDWQVWTKPHGKAYATIIVIGAGGGGAIGAIGALGNAAGGGGGGSGAMTVVEIPLSFLPARLYISAGAADSGNGAATRVSTQPNLTASHGVVFANGGGGAGAGVGATAGFGGLAGAVATASAMPLGWAFAKLALVGHPGTAGGSTGIAPNYTLPTTGIRVNGGTGGGGLPAAGVGSSGGGYTIPAQTYFPAHSGGAGGSTSTSPPEEGRTGYAVEGPGDDYHYGGTGSGSTHTTATGGGLLPSVGGNGGVGSGGGGGGGALTGSPASIASKGGPGLVIITCY